MIWGDFSIVDGPFIAFLTCQIWILGPRCSSLFFFSGWGLPAECFRTFWSWEGFNLQRQTDLRGRLNSSATESKGKCKWLQCFSGGSFMFLQILDVFAPVTNLFLENCSFFFLNSVQIHWARSRRNRLLYLHLLTLLRNQDQLQVLFALRGLGFILL